PNLEDGDIDADGVPDEHDTFPNNPDAAYDYDLDGIADPNDTDRDGDGVNNDGDYYPNDPARHEAPVLTITSPLNGAVFEGGSFVVTGTLDAPLNTGVTVNGVVAHRGGVPYGNEFAARVPLAPGANEINVTATLLSGKQVTATLTVTSNSESQFGVYASPNNGIAPTTANITVVNINNLTIQQIELDFDGDGGVDQIVDSNFEAAIPYEYAESGIYFPRITILDSDDVRHTETLVIGVQTKEQIDNLLKDLWNDMNSALMGKNHSLAVEHLTANSGYSEIFYLLLPHMNDIIPNYTAIVPVDIALTLGEYAVGEQIDGIDRVFFIQLLQDIFGVWRVEGM
ncbi:MAG: hypothetical protein GY779_18450, partial [Gammaproteobacteria bacterium]|nr:hypothetical protein [Gammaproteobacteria bacterium]